MRTMRSPPPPPPPLVSPEPTDLEMRPMCCWLLLACLRSFPFLAMRWVAFSFSFPPFYSGMPKQPRQ